MARALRSLGSSLRSPNRNSWRPALFVASYDRLSSSLSLALLSRVWGLLGGLPLRFQLPLSGLGGVQADHPLGLVGHNPEPVLYGHGVQVVQFDENTSTSGRKSIILPPQVAFLWRSIPR